MGTRAAKQVFRSRPSSPPTARRQPRGRRRGPAGPDTVRQAPDQGRLRAYDPEVGFDVLWRYGAAFEALHARVPRRDHDLSGLRKQLGQSVLTPAAADHADAHRLLEAHDLRAPWPDTNMGDGHAGLARQEVHVVPGRCWELFFSCHARRVGLPTG